ncbi:hypothetical protein LC653_40535 [Nostoc sp. CHAB 5784]|uniref:hypothetical protein n=1 Tax=Nostoc mirabile TaxID=2907820 RepID=UPI001E5187C1|nr:hypothetical protein [Nostoc mirabile]MCC5669930.1 hypothetical protein [Nostoc mirabile CHAB5784]
MCENLKQQLDNLSKEDLEEILSPLNSLITRLVGEIKIYTDLNCKNENGENTLVQNKQNYDHCIQNTLIDLKKSWKLRMQILYNITNFFYAKQITLIDKAYKEATNINDLYEKLTLLIKQLKDKEKLKNSI